MSRLASFPLMLVFACGLAGLYGALHNQVSYTIGPDYFHHLKFAQFGIPDSVSPRLGAAAVGSLASWWMGIVIGLPLATLAMLVQGPARRGLRVFILSSVVVVAIALILGLASLFLPITPEMAARVIIPDSAADPDGFVRAALLHGVSYLAGLIGLVVGLVVIGVAVWRSRSED